MTDLALNAYLQRSKERILATLTDWLRIPSISADPDHAGDVAASAEFCAGLLREAGMTAVEILATGTAEAPGSGRPAVYAEWLEAGPDAPTVLIYGHHDVQPVDPLDEWTSPPFEPVVVGDELLARGSADDKGQVLMQIEAAPRRAGRTGPSARQLEVPHRRRGGSRQPPPRGPPLAGEGEAGRRRRGGVRHHHGSGRHPLDHGEHAGPGLFRRHAAHGPVGPAQRDMGRHGPQRRLGGRPPRRPACTTPTGG